MDKLSKVIKQIEENELLDKDEIVNQLKEINRQTTVTFKKNEIELAELIIARIDKTYKRFGATLEDIYTTVSDDEMRRWIGTNANITKCFFASKYGYEVEKELSWVVKRFDGTIVTQFALCGLNGKNWCIDTDHPNPLIFTNKEKADAVALLVDGEVVEG